MTDTLHSYDEIPYESFPITETHPDRMAVIARLFGVAAANPGTARILELGCAAGGNLLPMAWFLPQTSCLGIELARAQAELGQQRIRELGLGNAEIRHLNILDLPLVGEAFDYIIAHGVYSWVPPAVQDHLLQLCAARLSPNGIAYISYNTLPGGHLRAMLRDMLLYHVRDLSQPRERLAAARELLDFLATPTTDAPPGHGDLQAQIHRLRTARDSYLYHEYLAEQNEPVLFSDFNARAEAYGLQFLGESQLHTLFASTLGDAANTCLSHCQGLVAEEQYSDFLRLRPFRQTLLCRTTAPVQREIALEDLFTLPLYTDLSPGPKQRWQSASGQTFSIERPVARQFVKTLGAQFPRAGDCREILAAAADSATQRRHTHAGANAGTETTTHWLDLFNLFVSGALQFSLLPPDPAHWRPALRSASEPRSPGHPSACALARALARQGERHIPTPRHQALQLDAISAQMLLLLDGSRDHTTLVQALEALVTPLDNLPGALRKLKPERRNAQLAAQLQQFLQLLERHGLLDHSPMETTA